MAEDTGSSLRLLVCVPLFLVLAAITLLVSSRQMPPTGDEPHYLTVSHSLAFDHDLSLLNNYKDRHYRAFYPGELAKRTTPSADNKRELPAEGLGLSFLLTPFYGLVHQFLPASFLIPVLRLLMCSITVIVLYFLIWNAQLLGASARGIAWIVPGAALASPLVTYSSQFYPEILAALVVAVSLWCLEKLEEHPLDSLVCLGLAPGALLWLHPKYLALAIAVIVISVWKTNRIFRIYGTRSGKILLLLALSGLGVFSFFWFLKTEYGSWSPNRIYWGWENQRTLFEIVEQEGFARIWIMLRMAAGFWIDQRFGVIPYAPLYVATFPAWIWLIRNDRVKFFPPAILFVAHFVSLCWGAPLGGYAPPSRHFVVLLPILIASILLIEPHWKKAQRFVFAGFIFAGLGVSYAMLTHYRALFSDVTWRNPDAISPFWQVLRLESWIPLLTAQDLSTGLILLWISCVALVSLLLYPRNKMC